MLRRCLRGWLVDEEGSVAVEMAVITPLLLLLLLGASDFAKVYRAQMRLVGATKAGAQYGAQSKLTASDIAGIQAAAHRDANDLDAVEVEAQYYCRCGEVAQACTNTCAGGVAPSLFVEVTASGTFTTAMRYPGIPDSIPLEHTTTVRVE